MQVLAFDNLQVNVLRKKIRNFYLRVQSNGCISLSVPWRTDEQAILKFLYSKQHWLSKSVQQCVTEVKQTSKVFVTGEKHFFQGIGYPLDIIEGTSHDINIQSDKLVVSIVERSPLTVKYLLNTWYKQQLDLLVGALLAKWQPIVGVLANSYQIKTMKSRWGSCHIENRVITLNLELIKMPIVCLEYVVVHELVHLHEASHNHRFKKFMDQFLPAWRTTKKALNDFSRQHDIGMI